MNAVANSLWHSFFHNPTNLTLVISGTEVRHDDQLILELLSAFDNVVDMRVTELVNLLAPMFRPEECQFGD